MAAGAMRVIGSPITAGGAKAGETTQDVAIALGSRRLENTLGLPTESISAVLATAADMAAQLYAIPKAVAGAATKVASKLAAPMANKYGKSAARTIKLADEFDIPTTAAQRTGSAPLAQLEALPTRTPIGVQPMAEFGKQQESAIKRAINQIGENISPENLSREEAGRVLKNSYQEASKAARASVDNAYGAVKTAIPDTELFNNPGLLKAASDLNKEVAASKGIIKTKPENVSAKIAAAMNPDETKIPPGLPAHVVDALKQKFGAIDDPNRMMSFQGMDAMRKDLRDMLQIARAGHKDNEVRQIGLLIDGLTDDMRATANKFPDAFKLLEQADQQFKTEIAPFFTKGAFPRVLSEHDASQITKTMISANRDRPERIELVKRAIDKPEEFNKVVRSWWQDLGEKSIDPRTGVFSSDRFMTNYNRYTPEVRASLLEGNAPQADRLAELLGSIDRSGVMGANPSQTARGLLAASQVGLAVKVAGDLFTGNFGGAIKGGMLLLSPLGLAKVVTSPTGIELLSKGLMLPAGTQQAIEMSTRLLALSNAMRKEQKIGLLQDERVNIQDKINAAMGQTIQ